MIAFLRLSAMSLYMPQVGRMVCAVLCMSVCLFGGMVWVPVGYTDPLSDAVMSQETRAQYQRLSEAYQSAIREQRLENALELQKQILRYSPSSALARHTHTLATLYNNTAVKALREKRYELALQRVRLAYFYYFPAWPQSAPKQGAVEQLAPVLQKNWEIIHQSMGLPPLQEKLVFQQAQALMQPVDQVPLTPDRLKEATALYSLTLKYNPKHTEAAFGLLQNLSRLGYRENATLLADRLAQPDLLLLVQAQSAIERGRYQEAVTLLDAPSATHPENASFQTMLYTAWDGVRRTQPENALSYLNMGVVRQRQHRYEEALSLYQQSLLFLERQKQNPAYRVSMADLLTPQLNMASCWLAMKRYPEAEKALKQMLTWAESTPPEARSVEVQDARLEAKRALADLYGTLHQTRQQFEMLLGLVAEGNQALAIQKEAYLSDLEALFETVQALPTRSEKLTVLQQLTPPDHLVLEKWPKALFRLASVYEQLKAYDEASGVYVWLEKLTPQDPNVLFHQGVLAVLTHHTETAQQRLQQGQTLYPQATILWEKLAQRIRLYESQALLQKGWEALDAQQWHQAVLAFEQAMTQKQTLQSETQLWRILWGLAQAQSHLLQQETPPTESLSPSVVYKHYQDAFDLAQKQRQQANLLPPEAVPTQEELADLAIEVGLFSQAQKQWWRAEQYYQKALVYRPNDTSLKRSLHDIKQQNIQLTKTQAIALYQAGKYPQAVQRLEEALARYPHTAEFYYLQGLSYTAMNQPQKAYQVLKQWQGLSPQPAVSQADAVYVFAVVCEQLKKLPEALKAYQQYSAFMQKRPASQYTKEEAETLRYAQARMKVLQPSQVKH
ncbi:MAG: tetratricopeptide repeat protein [Vampirovibrionales bacterium]